MNGFLFPAFIYLGAAVIAVPLAKRLGLGSVLGYLFAGILIGPAFGLVGSETKELQQFAEFGVVMMLFIVGLELEPRALWRMRAKLLGLGGLQVLISAALISGAGLLLGLHWSVALAVGLVLSPSSTAIVLQTLTEKTLMKSSGGQSSLSVLLFQDIAVIPMLALLPLLAMPEIAGSIHHLPVTGEGAHGAEGNLVQALPGWQIALVNLGAIAAVIIGGHFLSRPLFRFIAGAQLREIFTITALFLVIAIALLMTLVGLSPALGTFLAGVVLANSEFRHELQSNIEPFKGLLLGLFFITVGAGIDFGVLFGDFAAILGLTAGILALKAAVLLALARAFRMGAFDRWLFALGLAQAGEFGFVLLSFSVQNAVIPAALAETLLLVVALSMLFTPLLFIFLDRILAPRLTREQTQESDMMADAGIAIIAGHGRFGQIVNRILLANGFRTIVLDHKAEVIDGLRKFGVRTIFGDASRPELLLAAGLQEASLLVVAIDDEKQSLKLIENARRMRPDIHIVARASDLLHVYRLHSSGANDIVRETFDSSIRAARHALEALGIHPAHAEESTAVFVDQDVDVLRKLGSLWKSGIPVFENEYYLALTQQLNRETETTICSNGLPLHDLTDRGWMPQELSPDIAEDNIPEAIQQKG